MKLSAGADIRDGSRHSYYPMTTKYGSSVNGDANINSANREDYVADMVFNFQKTFKERHKLLALLGYSYQVQNDDGAYARAMGFINYRQVKRVRWSVLIKINTCWLLILVVPNTLSKTSICLLLLPVSMVATVLERTTVMLSFLREHLRGE